VLDPAGSPLSSTSVSVTPTPLQFEEVKTAVAGILGEELQLDTETILLLSRDFQFEEATTLDEYGLDSLTAMKIAGRLTQHFDLLVSAQTIRKPRTHARIRARLIRLLLFFYTCVVLFLSGSHFALHVLSVTHPTLISHCADAPRSWRCC
jgi:acyl carrier protein